MKWFRNNGTNNNSQGAIFRVSWSAANGGLRNGGLSELEDVWGNKPFSSVFWNFQVLLGPSKKKKSEKRRERARKADVGRCPGRDGRHPFSPHLLHPHLRQPNSEGTHHHPRAWARLTWWTWGTRSSCVSPRGELRSLPCVILTRDTISPR